MYMYNYCSSPQWLGIFCVHVLSPKAKILHCTKQISPIVRYGCEHLLLIAKEEDGVQKRMFGLKEGRRNRKTGNYRMSGFVICSIY